jgi:hypothetical protein
MVVLTGCGAGREPAPHLAPDFQRGVNHAHIHRRGHGYGSDASAAELARLKGLGVNCIAITPFAFQPGATANEIRGFTGHTDRSLTDEDLAGEIAHAHQLGLRVTLKPHLWSRDFWNGDEWQGSIRQLTTADHARWWASYRQFALHYAGVAESAHADLFCIGTELVGMTTEHPEEWRELIGAIRQVYHGPLTYAGHSGREFDQIKFWDALDFIGISAYFPLDAPVGASVNQLVAAWRPHRRRIEQVQARFRRPVLFMELGYRAVADCHQKPWVYTGGKADDAAQARAFEAVFRAFAGATWWKGTYIWKTFTDPALTDGDDGTDYELRGRPAEEVLRRWYRGQ